MSFRKRNIVVRGSQTSSNSDASPSSTRTVDVTTGLAPHTPLSAHGVRPSPLDGSPITSTGTPSLDQLLAGYAGLALGNLLLLEESGATDYAGTLLRYYAAEGILQQHKIHVVGVDEHWVRDLPGLASARGSEKHAEKAQKVQKEKMKIAWRYERFGNSSSRAQQSVDSFQEDTNQDQRKVFCHNFDLTKRIELQDLSQVNILPVRPASNSASPFTAILDSLSDELSSDDGQMIHRVVVPSILSPAFYPPNWSLPEHILRFLHSLRALLRTYSARLSAMISLPISLYPREAGLTRWIELLSDGVLELIPFPHTIDAGPSLAMSGAATAQEEKPQGMARLHRLPMIHEQGGGGTRGSAIGEDLAFTVTRRRFVIRPFSLPPVEGDTEAQKGETDGKSKRMDIEF